MNSHMLGEHLVRMRDGVRLATDVYLPERFPGRIPAVLVRGCYDKSHERSAAARIAEQLNERGYGIVFQDVRGTFASEGERTPWLHEADDGFDTIDWVVRQSWCDERVAMLGDSYLGFTQWAAAASAHPALRAIAPRVASQRVPDRWFAGDVASSAGVEWLARWWSSPPIPDGDVLDLGARPLLDVIHEELENARRLHREFLSINGPELHAATYPSAVGAAALSVPALHAGAWFDVMTLYQMRDWAAVSERSPAAGDQYLVMGADDHSGNPFRLDAAVPPGDLDAARARRLDAAATFFDRYVRGRELADPLPRVRYEIANAGWRTADRWPPTAVRELRLLLVGGGQPEGDADGGSLSDGPSQRAESSWVHDPADPVPSLAPVDYDMCNPLLPDERPVHGRPDVLTFTAEAARAPLDLVGPVALDVAVGSSAPSMHLVAMLTDVAPDGRAGLIAEGIARIDTRYGTATATVQLGSTAYRLRAGHRLRLAISSSRFPRYLVHPGTDDNLWTAVEARPATQTLITGGASGSLLRLSTLPA